MFKADPLKSNIIRTAGAKSRDSDFARCDRSLRIKGLLELLNSNNFMCMSSNF